MAMKTGVLPMVATALAAAVVATFTSPAGAQCTAATPPAACQPIAASTTPAADITISDCRTVAAGTHTYQYVHVVDGGTLFFLDQGGAIDFRAKSVLVEQGGSVKAGEWDKPFGCGGTRLAIGIYGAGPTAPITPTHTRPNYAGIQCSGPNGACYDASRVGKGCFDDGTGGFDPTDPCQATLSTTDRTRWNSYFEGYDDLDADDSPFGYKVFAVSYGGSVELFGRKGVADADRTDPATRRTSCPVPAAADQPDITKWAALTGSSWVRAAATNQQGATTLVIDRQVDWQADDELIVGTTDWSTSHSERVTVAGFDAGTKTLTLAGPLAHVHNGEAYEVPATLTTPNPNTHVENRAAVGLLTRSITVRSLGDTAADPFPAAAACGPGANDPDCYFGAHLIVRQGFARFQVQGVAFESMGQGGRMGHYPVHFHMVKDASYTNAFVRDSSIVESNTRFIVLHASHGIELSRNVGYLSMGHGYYLEDGSEIDNLLCQNLGVSARAAFEQYFEAHQGSPEGRLIPPILDHMADGSLQGSDAVYPTMFWIMNAYNEFVGNQAVGVHGFGACYWPLSSSVSGPSVYLHWARESASSGGAQTFSELDYANFNQAGDRQAPFKRFRGNSCTTAPYALMTERSSIRPNGCDWGGCTSAPTLPSQGVDRVSNPYDPGAKMLPVVRSNFYGIRHAISPDQNPTCAPSLPPGVASSNGKYCMATVIDRLTTSFNWAEVGLGSVWLRPWGWVFINSAITDQLYGGLGFVSGGSWNQVLDQQLALTRDSIFVGSVSPGSATAGETGPSLAGALCRYLDGTIPRQLPFCFSAADGTGFYLGSYNPKRLLTIYDGPFFADGSVFAGTAPFDRTPVTQSAPPAPLTSGASVYDSTNQPEAAGDASRYRVIDAAIGWKQPNGFYYPPAFAFRGSAFDAGTERHNVFDLYTDYWQGSLIGAPVKRSLLEFGDVTPIDSTTILNDLDGTLNGVVPSGGPPRTAGLSNNHFYDVPFSVAQCNSFGTDTIPHDFVTTVITRLDGSLAGSATATANTDPTWGGDQPVVAVYRQLMTGTAGEDCSAEADVCGAGTTHGCRRGSFFLGANIGAAPGLTMNGGRYYIDTATSDQPSGCKGNLGQLATFEAGKTYFVHHLFSTAGTEVTYDLFVGKGLGSFEVEWARVDPHVYNPSNGDSIHVTRSAQALGPSATDYDPQTGILTVTLSNATIAADYAFPATTTNACQPRNLCKVDTSSPTPTGCTLNDAEFTEVGLTDAMRDICEFWVSRTNAQSADGVYLNDCPHGGCIGFAFTLPAAFSAESYDSLGQPGACCYPQATPWTTSLTVTDPSCQPAPPATGNFCSSPAC